MERLIDGRLVDGVILARTRCFDTRVTLLPERAVPLVTAGAPNPNAPVPWLDTGNEEAFCQATPPPRRWATAAGPDQRPGLPSTYAALRERGFLRACLGAGLQGAELPRCPLPRGELPAPSRASGLAKVLPRRCRVDFARNAAHRAGVCHRCTGTGRHGRLPRAAAAGRRALRRNGLRRHRGRCPAIPRCPPSSTPSWSDGRHLADMLLGVMAGEDIATLNRLGPIHFIERAFCVPRSLTVVDPRTPVSPRIYREENPP